MEPTVTAHDFDMSATIAEFSKAMPKAQAAMGDVIKAATNPAFRSRYADLAAVVEATIPALNANGFSVLQPAGFDGQVVKVSTMLLHESGEWMRSTLSLRPTKADPQGVGSAITYGRRYGLQAMTGVAPEDDDGNAASAPAPRAQAQRAPSPEPRPAPPSQRPVDRTDDVVPAPAGDFPADWIEWRDVLAAKIKRAGSVEAVNAIVAAHKETLGACQELLPDTDERVTALVDAKLARLNQKEAA